MISQLSLFDTAAEVGSIYKAGDWVKLRRKPTIAAWVKRGEIYKVNAVHPIDGSLQFWNPHTNQWDFLCPDEVKLVLPPVDSVTPVEPVVTEYTVPPAEDYFVTPVEPVVTESKVPPAEDYFVTSVEPVVTEYTVPPAEDDSVTSNAISTYRPRGTARSGEYFRLSYRDGGRVRHQHIRGGNTDSPISQGKVAEVRSLLAAGISPASIATMLKVAKTSK